MGGECRLPAIRALLIDLDGVVRRWDPANDARAEAAAGLPPGALRRAAFAADLLRPAITGAVTDEQWRRQVLARLRAEHPHADTEIAVRLWSESCGAVEPAVLDLVIPCRTKVRVVLVTNATTRLGADLARLGLATAFDHVVNSSAVGSAKPDARIYMEALGRAAVPAQEALFVDDAEANVAAAAALGMQTHWYRGADELAQLLRGHRLA